ncbi:hypothetical protein B0H14DRAFT_2717718, partial [Mycena olivaceomarginata]
PVLKANNADHTKWSNPPEVQLPHAPSMKLYCSLLLYAHGNEYDEMADSAAGTEPQCVDPPTARVRQRTPFDTPLLRKSWIDAEVYG